MKEKVILREKGNHTSLENQFEVKSSLVTMSLNFDRNSITARKIRAYAVNHMQADVFLKSEHLI